MPFHWGARKTFSDDNQFRFVCPIFHAETRIHDCLSRRDTVWVGKPITEPGCAVALHASKCPIVHVVNDMVRNGEDPYYSAEPVVGRLEYKILERIAPVLVRETEIDKAGLNPEDRKALLDANAAARDGVRPSAQPKVTRKSRTAQPKPESSSDAPLPTQDLASLVTAMVAEEAAKPKAPEPAPAVAQAPPARPKEQPKRVAKPVSAPSRLPPTISLLELARRAKEASK